MKWEEELIYFTHVLILFVLILVYNFVSPHPTLDLPVYQISPWFILIALLLSTRPLLKLEITHKSLQKNKPFRMPCSSHD